MYVSITQLFTPGSGGRLDSMHKSLNMGVQNIGFLQQTLTGLCNLIGNLEQKMHHLYQNGTSQLIRSNSTNSPRGGFYYDFLH